MADLAFTRGLSRHLDATEWALVRTFRRLPPLTDKERDVASGRFYKRMNNDE